MKEGYLTLKRHGEDADLYNINGLQLRLLYEAVGNLIEVYDDVQTSVNRKRSYGIGGTSDKLANLHELKDTIIVSERMNAKGLPAVWSE